MGREQQRRKPIEPRWLARLRANRRWNASQVDVKNEHIARLHRLAGALIRGDREEWDDLITLIASEPIPDEWRGPIAAKLRELVTSLPKAPAESRRIAPPWVQYLRELYSVMVNPDRTSIGGKQRAPDEARESARRAKIPHYPKARRFAYTVAHEISAAIVDAKKHLQGETFAEGAASGANRMASIGSPDWFAIWNDDCTFGSLERAALISQVLVARKTSGAMRPRVSKS